MRDEIVVITPYYPSDSKPSHGIFVYEQLVELGSHYDKVNVLVLKPLFNLSRKVPFVSFTDAYSELKPLPVDKYEVKCVRYLPFKKDSSYYHRSIALSLKHALRAYDSISTRLVHTIYPVGSAYNLLGSDGHVVIHGSDLRYFMKNPAQLTAIKKTLSSLPTISVSEGIKLDVLSISPDSKNTVVYNGLSSLGYNAYPLEETTNKEFSFLYVGGLINLKGVHVLLDAYRIFCSQHPNSLVNLHIVGTGIERSNMERFVKSEKLSRVKFWGHLDNSLVQSLMKSCQVLLLPSYQEGFGRVIIEMFRHGNPVITTVSGGPEFLVKPFTGNLVSPGDSQALSDAMYDVYNNYSRFNKLEIYKYFLDNYDSEIVTQKLVNEMRKK